MVNWFVNGMEIKPSPHYEMLYEDGKSVLLIIEVGPEDTGEYTVKAKTEELGEVVSSTTLYVQGKLAVYSFLMNFMNCISTRRYCKTDIE